MKRPFAPSDAGLHDALARARVAGSDVDVGIVEAERAPLHASRGETHKAVGLLDAPLEHLSTVRDLGTTILTLEAIGELTTTYGAVDDATIMLGATTGTRSAMGARVPTAAAARLQQMIDTAERAARFTDPSRRMSGDEECVGDGAFDSGVGHA